MSTKAISLAKPYTLFFLALANPARMQIISLLREKARKRGMSVSEICVELGLEQTHVSHSLKCLTFCGLVTSNREGKSRIYFLNKKTVLPLLALIDAHLEKYATNLYECDSLER